MASIPMQAQEFETASIKPSAPAQGGRMMIGIQTLPGGRVSMSNVTVKILLQQAYNIRDFQIVGGPSWISTERYDIVAKPEGSATDAQVKVMLQSLLKDRFKLEFRRETRELPTYALVIAKGGPKLKVSDAPREDQEDRGGGRGEGGGGGRRGMVRMGRGHFEATGAPISALINQLAIALRRSVIDKTGLTGEYDFNLDWAPDETGRGPAAEGSSSTDAEGPSIFTALQEKLGLKLEATKGPVEVFVIGSAEKASEN